MQNSANQNDKLTEKIMRPIFLTLDVMTKKFGFFFVWPRGGISKMFKGA